MFMTPSQRVRERGGGGGREGERERERETGRGERDREVALSVLDPDSLDQHFFRAREGGGGGGGEDEDHAAGPPLPHPPKRSRAFCTLNWHFKFLSAPPLPSFCPPPSLFCVILLLTHNFTYT